MERLLSPRDLADRHQVPIKTIYKWNSEGTGPVRIRVGRHIRYRLDDVERWEAENAVDGRHGDGPVF